MGLFDELAGAAKGAIFNAAEGGIQGVLGNVIGDAAEVIQHANRALRTGRAEHAHAATFLALMSGSPRVRIRWIKREQNLAGIVLAARHPR